MPLVGNKVAEKDLRDWLDGHGCHGRSARVRELELAAIGRPGWVQVFRFAVEAKRKTDDEAGGWEELRGYLRDDERRGYEVRLTPTEAERVATFAEWSRGLVVLREGRRSWLEIGLLVIFAVILSAAAAVELLR